MYLSYIATYKDHKTAALRFARLINELCENGIKEQHILYLCEGYREKLMEIILLHRGSSSPELLYTEYKESTIHFLTNIICEYKVDIVKMFHYADIGVREILLRDKTLSRDRIRTGGQIMRGRTFGSPFYSGSAVRMRKFRLLRHLKKMNKKSKKSKKVKK